MLLIKTGVLNAFFLKTELFLKEMKEKNIYLVYLIIACVLICSLVFILPAHMIICLIASMILKNYWYTYLFLVLVTVAGSAFIYLITKCCLKGCIEKRVQKSEYYQVIKEESQSNPWRTAFLTRMIFIGAGMKDYILAVIENPFPSYLASSFVLNGFFTIESVLIA